jgi:hypothetical protein
VPGESGSSTRQGFKTKLFKTQKLEWIENPQI